MYTHAIGFSPVRTTTVRFGEHTRFTLMEIVKLDALMRADKPFFWTKSFAVGQRQAKVRFYRESPNANIWLGIYVIDDIKQPKLLQYLELDRQNGCLYNALNQEFNWNKLNPFWGGLMPKLKTLTPADME